MEEQLLLFVNISHSRTGEELYKHGTKDCSLFYELVRLLTEHLSFEGNMEGLPVKVQEIYPFAVLQPRTEPCAPAVDN